MNIRNAQKEDIPSLLHLLDEVNKIHADKRPDIFKRGQKYEAKELEELLQDPKVHILVADEDEKVLGYAFLFEVKQEETELLKGRKFLYLDDLCIDENTRGKGVGHSLLKASEELAKALGYPSLQLRVWELNENAIAFYEKNGFEPLYYEMEKKID